MDERFMKRALELAVKARGKTSPNPLVGAVVVKDNRIAGEGYHKKAGGPHAEIIALKQAGGKAKGARLYVTLEPCSTYGKTPPCVPAIKQSGIKKIVISMIDPNPVNKNRGIAFLKKEGIEVKTGVLREEAEKINEAYSKFITKGMPFVTIKAAMSIDGKIASRTGSSKWISCGKSRCYVKKIRKEAEAVLVGFNTYIKDKPRFKGVKNKIILPKGRVNLRNILKSLAKKGIMHVLIEGGGETIASAIEQGLADRLIIFIAPKIIGGRSAVTPVEGKGISDISGALNLKEMKAEWIGKDIMITAKL